MSTSPDDLFRDYLGGYEPFVADSGEEITEVTAFIPISTDLAMDCGLIPDTRPPYVARPLSRRMRFRFWRARARTKLAVRFCRWLAGCDLHDDELI